LRSLRLHPETEKNVSNKHTVTSVSLRELCVGDPLFAGQDESQPLYCRELPIMIVSSESRKRYRGPVRAVIFDWAGTTVDYGSMAPVDAFIELFRRHGVTVSAEEARRPMGSYKKDHVRLILDMEPVTRQWQRLHGRSPSPEDVELLYREFIPLQT